MKGFKFIALFSALILLSYFGVLFVEANREEVIIAFGRYRTAPAALGFVVMTSVLIGMVLGALLCSLEILYLFFRSQSLQRKLNKYEKTQAKAAATQASSGSTGTESGPAKPSFLSKLKPTIPTSSPSAPSGSQGKEEKKGDDKKSEEKDSSGKTEEPLREL